VRVLRVDFNVGTVARLDVRRHIGVRDVAVVHKIHCTVDGVLGTSGATCNAEKQAGPG